jgi:hypothetical protein
MVQIATDAADAEMPGA